MTKHVSRLEKGTVEMVKSFSTMVKSGEQYYTEQDNSDIVLRNASERPRNIFVPPDENCGFLVYIQSLLWAPLRKGMDGFIQGYAKKDYKQWLTSRIDNDWSSISIDGSAFDSTQFAPLMDCCENKFFTLIQNSDRCRTAMMDMVGNRYGKTQTWEHMSTHAIQNLWNSLWQSARVNKVVAFTYLPNYCRDNQRWPDSIHKEWEAASIQTTLEVSARPWRYYLATPLNGTTFSGHSTKTTLGNTMRSIMYMYFYIWDARSRDLPWSWSTFQTDYPV